MSRKPYIVSLSAIPSRFRHMGPVLASLLAQNQRPEKVIVYIPKYYRRFPDYAGELPQLPEGVELRIVEQDLGPATKVLPASREFAGQNLDLIYCDDDRLMLPTWAERLLRAREAHPGAAVCAYYAYVLEELGIARESLPQPRPRRIGRFAWAALPFTLARGLEKLRAGGAENVELRPERPRYANSGWVDIAEGCGGVVISPGDFDDDAWNIPPVLWTVDDVWLSGQLAKRGIPIWCAHDAGQLTSVEALQGGEDALWRSTIEGSDRQKADRDCVRYMRETYGIWP